MTGDDAAGQAVPIVGNVENKYAVRNPIARMLVNGFLSAFDRLAGVAGPPGRVLEAGCGEGVLSLRLAQAGWDVSGFDISADLAAQAADLLAAHGFAGRFEGRDIYDLEPLAAAPELVVCCEVLEHLEEPGRALERLRDLGAAWYLLSVPREPLWRLLNLVRLKYVGALGNTPGHLRHWSCRAFRRQVAEYFEIVEFTRPLPWQMALCRLRPSRPG